MRTSTPTGPTPDHQLDRAARDVAGDSMADFVLKMDKRQSNPVVQKICPTVVKGKNAGHGALGVSGDGQWLICGRCEHREGISRGQIEQLEQQERDEAARLEAQSQTTEAVN